MTRKSLAAILAVVTVLLMGSVAIFAQTAPLSGKVELIQADGTKVPVKDALVEIYRTDISAGKPLTAKTDKRGGFVFAGIQLGGSFAIAISAPNAAPDLRGGIKAGMDNLAFTLNSGDGKRFTPEEVMQNLKSAQTTNTPQAPAESAEAKKAKAEYEAKVKEVTEKNKKIDESNKVVIDSLKAGNDAFNAGNYDLAITNYTTGINADPTHPGAPVLLANRSAALRQRGVKKYNVAASAKDTAGIDAAKKDFSDALESSNRAIQIIKETPAPTDPASLKNYEGAKYSALSTRAEDYRLVVTKVDGTKADDGLAAYKEYLAVETDPAKKSKAQMSAALMLFEAGNLDKAVPEFQKILEADPNNIDALAGLGLSLVSLGYGDGVTVDKAKFQEGVNYLQKYSELAPEGHKYKADALATIESIKNQQKIAPQKTGVTKKQTGKGKN